MILQGPTTRTNNLPAEHNTAETPSAAKRESVDDHCRRTAAGRGEYFLAPDKFTAESKGTGDQRTLTAPSRGEYLARDDSPKAVNELTAQLQKEFEALRVRCIGQDWLRLLELPRLPGRDTKERE